MTALAITASGQWWSATNGWLTPSLMAWPNIRTGQVSVSVSGPLANGTRILLRRRLRSVANNGTPFPVMLIDAAFLALKNMDGYSEDFFGVNASYEYDIGCPDTFGAGDTVYVELI